MKLTLISLGFSLPVPGMKWWGQLYLYQMSRKALVVQPSSVLWAAHSISQLDLIGIIWLRRRLIANVSSSLFCLFFSVLTTLWLFREFLQTTSLPFSLPKMNAQRWGKSSITKRFKAVKMYEIFYPASKVININNEICMNVLKKYMWCKHMVVFSFLLVAVTGPHFITLN